MDYWQNKIKEQIEVMTHALNNGCIEVSELGEWNFTKVNNKDVPIFNWKHYKYRIKGKELKYNI